MPRRTGWVGENKDENTAPAGTECLWTGGGGAGRVKSPLQVPGEALEGQPELPPCQSIWCAGPGGVAAQTRGR